MAAATASGLDECICPTPLYVHNHWLDFVRGEQLVLFRSARILLKEASATAHCAQRLLRKLSARYLHGSSRLLMQTKLSYAKLSLAEGVTSGSKRQVDYRDRSMCHWLR